MPADAIGVGSGERHSAESGAETHIDPTRFSNIAYSNSGVKSQNSNVPTPKARASGAAKSATWPVFIACLIGLKHSARIAIRPCELCCNATTPGRFIHPGREKWMIRLLVEGLS
ncbi:hypothetical protein [Streptomyces antibioticus]|uniref:hypothetical protein n=1 Tax=Streptomyces antibioticus TaxID=1890 RepID=UPI0033BF4E8F